MTQPSVEDASDPLDRRRAHILLWLGLLSLVLGLAASFVASATHTPQMAVSGALNGLVLVGVGLAWTKVRLGRIARNMSIGAFVWGTMANWLGACINALDGTRGTLGSVGTGLFLALALTMIAACVLALRGLGRRPDFTR